MNIEFFSNNRKKLANILEENSMVVLFAGEAPQRSADQHYGFTPNRNFFYITGIDKDKAIYVLSKTRGKVSETLFIEKSDSVLEKWIGKRMTPQEATARSGIDKIKYLEDFDNIVHQEVYGNRISQLYLDLEKRSFNSTPTKAFEFAKGIKEKYPQLNIDNIYNEISLLRMKKDPQEIGKIKKAIDITGDGIKALMRNCHGGQYEYQLEAHFDFTIKKLGAKEKAFHTIAASGKNATVLHYEENNSPLSDGDLILFDLGAEFEYYCADISRTIPINGKFTKRQRDVYEVVLKALEETTKLVKPGVTFQELNDYTKEILAKGCIQLGLIKDIGELGKYYYHGVGHFLGLDTHDVGDRFAKLEPGMVITIEPGLYIEEEGIGVRIEDDVLVTEKGFEVLSKDIIKTVEEIENFMSEK